MATRVSPSSFWLGVWRVVDPKITLASVASMVLGLGVAAHDGDITWGWLILTVVGVLCVEAAKNTSGDVVDWDSGTDQALTEEERTPFSGGKRILVDRLMSHRQATILAAAFYVLAAAAGLLIVVFREPLVIWVGALGMALAFFYHAPPLRLAYRGLGELSVAIAYGPVITTGTYLVQRHEVSSGALLTSVPLGLAIMAFLWINEMPDARADSEANKRTLVVRLGRRRASRVFALIIVATYGSLILLPVAGLPITVLLGLIGLPSGAAAAAGLWRNAEVPRAMVPAQVSALRSFLLLAVGSSVGWLLA